MSVLWDAVNVRNGPLRLWIFPVGHFLVNWCSLSCLSVWFFYDNYSRNDMSLFFWYYSHTYVYPKLLNCCVCVCLFNRLRRWEFAIYDLSPSLSLSLCAVLPGRLCDGPSSPCRPQATSCWAPPATSSSCWRRRSEQSRAWRCHRKAGSGSCRACCWERFATDDGLEFVHS